LSCGTFTSEKSFNKDYYDFQEYWHNKQGQYGFPSIERRAQDDFGDRIPFWAYQLKYFPDAKSVLEIGAGHGGFLQHCRNNGFEKAIGVEVSPETCAFAKKMFGIEMICGEFPYIDMDYKFDLICAFDVIEHLRNPIDAINKMSELSNGILIQTPCYRGEGNSFPHFHPDEHLFIFTDDAIKRLVGIGGFSIVTSARGAFNWDITIIGAKK
jgi:SAM-dependent methyltransferase